MNTIRKVICVFLAVLTIAGLFLTGALAAEPTDFEQTDSPMIYNTTDSSRLPGYPADIESVYGQVDAADAAEIDSMFSDEARERFSEQLDRILDFEPVADAEVAPVLGGAEEFVKSGALAAYLKDGNLLAGSGIGLKSNRDDKVKVLGADTNASAWVFVVDKDAMCYWVKDEDGMGIPNALVTISYLDDSGRRITSSVVTTGGHTPGIAVFDSIPDTFFGIVDIQAEGYRAVSILDKYMEAGEHYTVVLSEAQENELYIRGVDLSGKDMVNEDTKLSLVDRNTGDLSLKVIVTRTGSAVFPDSIDIYSENREQTVLTVSNTTAYDYASDTRVYVADRRWAEKSAGLLQEKDEVSVKFSGNTFGLGHLTVEDAVFDPGTKDRDMPVTTEQMPGNVSDRMGGSGIINITAQILQVPVTVGFFPDGNMIIMAAYDITNLDKNTQYKYSSLFDKSWNPKTLSNSEPAFQVFEKSFWENAEKVKGGKEVLNSKDKIKCLQNRTYEFSMSFSVYLRSCYNEDTGDNYGTGGIMFSGGLTGGITEYFLFPVGPIVIPAYIGFEAGFKIYTALNITFNTDKPPAGQGDDTKWRYANNGDTDLSARIEVLVSFSVFGGVGVKGVLGASATGYANLDIATVLGGGSDGVFSDDPHSFIDALYGLRFDYYLLFFSGTVNIDCLKGAERLYDSRGEYDRLLNDGLLTGIDFEDLDLEACADRFVPVLNDSGEPRDRAFRLEDESALPVGSSNTSYIDSSTYPDNQAQFVATKNYTALFRLASTGEKTWLIYQLLGSNGNLSSTYFFVEMPAGETRAISEFVAVPNKTDRDDPDSCDNVYIGAVLVDNTLQDESERMRSTDVAAIVVNVDRRLTTSSVIASDSSVKGQYYYSAPMPAGREDYCSVAYAATALRDDNGGSVDSLRALMGAIPATTSYCISSCEAGRPDVRAFTYLGSNKVHSSGVIAPNEPSYWTVDKLRSSDKWLVVRGYGSNGYYAEDLRCNFRIDIDGIIDIADIRNGTANYDGIITNWQYLNGCNYFIAGDSVYWMNKETKGGDPSNYEWVVEKVKNGSGVISAENRFTMITNNNQSAIYLIGVVEDYNVDMETGTAAKAANRTRIYTLITDRNWSTGKITSTLHGPLDLKFADGEVITSFTAAYNPDSSQAKGLTIAYSTPNGTGTVGPASLRMWKQNADRGLLITDLRIPDYLIKEDQPYIDIYVTVRNYGYGRENPVPYTVRDESGYWFAQYIDGVDVGETYYTGDELYTGDTRVDKLQIKPNPGWSLNEEHEIIVEIKDEYRYNGDLDDVVNSARLTADNTSLTAENTLTGGRHCISTKIVNNTMIGEETPVVKVVLDYGEKGVGRTLKFPLPTSEKLFRYDAGDEEPVEQIYHYDIDMDGTWKTGAGRGLLGAYVSLVNFAGVQQSNEVVYVPNPVAKEDGVACQPGFADVDPDAWYADAVDYVAANGLMRGTSPTTFEPATATTRAMIVTILHRLEGEPVVNAVNPFDDVVNEAWYTDAIVWAAANGIVEGYGNGKFGPNDDITREQLATILYRYAQYKGYDVSVGEETNILSYDDAFDVSSWAMPAMQWAVAEGIINGRTESTIVPQDGANRAEAAAMLMRFIENLK